MLRKNKIQASPEGAAPQGDQRAAAIRLISVAVLLVSCVFVFLLLHGSFSWLTSNRQVVAGGVALTVEAPAELTYDGADGVNAEFRNDDPDKMEAGTPLVGTLGPGDHGTLTLSFASNRTGTVTFDIAVEPTQKGTDADAYANAQRYLGKHIAFFSVKDPETDVYSDWMSTDENGIIHGSVEITEVNTPITMTLYWIWRLSYHSLGDAAVADHDIALINADMAVSPDYFDYRGEVTPNAENNTFYYDYADDTINKNISVIGFNIKISVR